MGQCSAERRCRKDVGEPGGPEQRALRNAACRRSAVARAIRSPHGGGRLGIVPRLVVDQYL